MDLSQIKLPKWAIVGIVALVLFGIGSAIYNSGWSQGFFMGVLTGSVDGNAITPYLAGRGQGWHGHGGPSFFGFFGAIFRVIFFVFLIGLIFKFLGFLRWRRHGWHSGPGSWGGPGSWHGGPDWRGGPGGHGERVEGHYGPWWNQPYQQQPQGQPQQGQPQQGQSQAQPTTPPSGDVNQGGSGTGGDEPKPTPTSWTRV